MKIPITVICYSCEFEFSTQTIGAEEILPAKCPKCGKSIHILEDLSVSLIADRLLYRSEHELNDGDYTISIICSAIAIETAFTQAFIKWKTIEHNQAFQQPATESEIDGWEEEYRKKTGGSFKRSANLVSDLLTGKTFDQFVDDFLAHSSIVACIKAGLPPWKSQTKLDHIYVELFQRRNKIMHWGKADYKSDDASSAFQAGRAALAVLKIMDKEKAQAMDRAWRAVTQSSAR